MNKLKTLSVLLFLILGLVGCSLNTSGTYLPNPSKGTNLTTTAGGFISDNGKLRYDLRFKFTRVYDFPVFLVAEFDNPADSSKPLMITSTIPASQEAFGVRSPGISKIENPANYTAKVFVYRDKSKQELLTQHSQTLLFKMDPQLLKAILR